SSLCASFFFLRPRCAYISTLSLHDALPISLSAINPEEYHALFLPGGHGPLWDLATDEICARIILDFYNSGKPVAAVCHGPAALIDRKSTRLNSSHVKISYAVFCLKKKNSED